jgi:hypothetical protein
MAGQEQELARLTTEVSEIEVVRDAVVTFIQGLAEMVRANRANPAELDALATRLDSTAASITDAILANTPAGPEAPPA